MQIKTEKKGTVNILRLSGKMTIGKGDVMLRETFVKLLDDGERQFIFDLNDVPYLDSAGVGETVGCYKRAAERGAVIKVVMLAKSKAHEVFIVSCLDRVFEIFADEDTALASFA